MNDSPTDPGPSSDDVPTTEGLPRTQPTTPPPFSGASDVDTVAASDAHTVSSFALPADPTVAEQTIGPAASPQKRTADQQAAPQPRRSRWPLMLAAAAAAAVMVLAGVAGYLTGDDDTVPIVADGPVQTSTTAEPRTSVAVSTTEPAPEPTQTPATTAAAGSPDNVLDEPAGQLCRDLSAKGYSYEEAVAYWDHHGRPDQMDASGTGIPCQTVYPREDVESQWGAAALAEPCPDSDALLASYPPEVAADIRGFGDIECTSGWVFAIMHTWHAESPGVVYRVDDGAIREMAMGTSDWKTGEAVQWCIDDLGMPAAAAQRFC